MRTLVQDLRFAFRQFRKSPGFVITAILSLMLGIGATTAIFSVIYGVLLDPYPYKDNDRMVHVQLKCFPDNIAAPAKLFLPKDIAQHGNRGGISDGSIGCSKFAAKQRWNSHVLKQIRGI